MKSILLEIKKKSCNKESDFLPTANHYDYNYFLKTTLIKLNTLQKLN